MDGSLKLNVWTLCVETGGRVGENDRVGAQAWHSTKRHMRLCTGAGDLRTVW